ncbi:glycosyltransferase family 2 protein [Sphingopyxis sp.]|uniref:glycosyltransferase family 2 protein n=1 Tax=Sphingopyxis sp. TaxID=1908224 RepID=UPI003D13EA07
MNSLNDQTDPQISVIVPAYGVAHLVGEALDSLIAQDFTAWEAIVIDDGAPDDVAGAVGRYLADPRIRFLATANHGVSAARNRAIAASRAPLIALLDGDDLFRPGYLAAMVAAMNDDPAATVTTCNARVFGAVAQEDLVVGDDQNLGATGKVADVLERRFNIYIGSTFRRAAFDRVGGFDTAMTNSEDLDLWVRLLMDGGHARYIDAVLADYRVRPRSASVNLLRNIRGNIRVCDKVIAAMPGTHEAEVAKAVRNGELERQEVEAALAAVIAGDTQRGLTILRAQRHYLGNPLWSVAFVLWGVVPWLAPPMLAWRQRLHQGSSRRRPVRATTKKQA